MRTLLFLLVSIAVAGSVAAGSLDSSANIRARSGPEAGKAKHVVLVVWDGMRPESVTEALTPTLWKLARAGVTFRHHHSVYPSLTNVNSTVLATGVFPAHSGLLANYEYRPELDASKFIRTDLPSMVRRGDELRGGKYLNVPTIAELVHAAGGRTAIAGGKTTSLLHDRYAAGSTEKGRNSVTIFSGETLPESALSPLVKLLGPFPDQGKTPGMAGDDWTTKALTEALWKDGVPPYSVLWLSEPDRAQHAAGPGSEMASAAVKSSDANLAMVLRALKQKRVRETTDVIVTSDHGFSTIQRLIDLRRLLQEAGFTVITDGDIPSKHGEIRVVGNGGTALFYITEHDAETAGRLVEWLQRSDFAGVIFSGRVIAGTFPLAQAQIDTPSAPDVVMAFRWSDELNARGVPGVIAALATADAAGTHGTLSKFDLHNILVAAGPDFRSGSVDELPTSNVDLAPTILHILGIKPPEHLDGRILREAMTEPGKVGAAAESTVIEATREFPTGIWRQYLKLSKVGEEVYVDEGNGAMQPKQPRP